MEPILDIDDIQGHVFPGFGTSHSVVIALQMTNPEMGRAALASLLPDVTTMAISHRNKESRREFMISGKQIEREQIPPLAISVAATAVRAWGIDTKGCDRSYHEGMRVDAASLGDVIGANAKPADWTFNSRESNRVDVLIVAGHETRQLLEQSVSTWLAKLLPAFTLVITEYGRRRLGDKEFFGFHDGVSQPAVRGITPGGDYLSTRVIAADDPRAAYYAKPGQVLVWPGSFLFGYPGQSPSVAQAGVIVQPPMPWMRNGSYLVFRRLLQDVVAFRNAVDGMELHLRQQGEEVPNGWAAARLVGRWPDGTPLTASPTGEDTNISENPNRINNFRFFASLGPTPLADSGEPPQMLPAVPADPLGLACPRASHIRQVNPRDGISEIGQENHPRKLMLRRGITFGPEVDDAPDADRGLLFLSYQTSIVEQFKFVQVNWANATQRPTGDGRDPIIGQDGTKETKRNIQIFAPSGRQFRCPFNGRWVIATGGEYFFTPSISGLKHLLGVQDGRPS